MNACACRPGRLLKRLWHTTECSLLQEMAAFEGMSDEQVMVDVEHSLKQVGVASRGALCPMRVPCRALRGSPCRHALECSTPSCYWQGRHSGRGCSARRLPMLLHVAACGSSLLACPPPTHSCQPSHPPQLFPESYRPPLSFVVTRWSQVSKLVLPGRMNPLGVSAQTSALTGTRLRPPACRTPSAMAPTPTCPPTAAKCITTGSPTQASCLSPERSALPESSGFGCFKSTPLCPPSIVSLVQSRVTQSSMKLNASRPAAMLHLRCRPPSVLQTGATGHFIAKPACFHLSLQSRALSAGTWQSVASRLSLVHAGWNVTSAPPAPLFVDTALVCWGAHPPD